MVPVMTLAVCAIAMVGLGFSLSSTVTSDSNAVEDLMIDMSNKLSYFQESGEAESHPGDDTVDKLLGITLTNTKEGITPGIKVTGGAAYMKIYGNIASGITLNVKVLSTENKTTPGSLTISLYEQGKISEGARGTVTFTGGEGSDFSSTKTFQIKNSTTSNTEISCETIYIVAITEVDGCELTYSETTTDNESTITGKVNGGTTISTKNISLKYVFTVTNDPTS